MEGKLLKVLASTSLSKASVYMAACLLSSPDISATGGKHQLAPDRKGGILNDWHYSPHQNQNTVSCYR